MSILTIGLGVIVILIVHWIKSERRFKNRVVCPRCYAVVTKSCGPNCAWDWTKEDCEKTCWLIERGQAVNHTPTIWYRGRPDERTDQYAQDWTERATLALRFSSKGHAEKMAARLMGAGTYTITEHMDIPAAAHKEGGHG
jgi:hypothetical protein